MTYRQKRLLKALVNTAAICAGVYLVWNVIALLYYMGRLAGMAVAVEHYARNYELRRKVS